MAKPQVREIEKLFQLAREAPQGLADRYVRLAQKLAQRQRISLRRYNRLFCRKCGAYWTSETLRVRTRRDSVVYACLACGALKRFRKR